MCPRASNTLRRESFVTSATIIESSAHSPLISITLASASSFGLNAAFPYPQMNLPPRIPHRPAGARANRASRVLWLLRLPEVPRVVPKLAALPAFHVKLPQSSQPNRTRPDSRARCSLRRFFPGKVFPAGRTDAARKATRPKPQPNNARSATRRKRPRVPAGLKLLPQAGQASSLARSIRYRRAQLAKCRDARVRKSRRPAPLAKLQMLRSSRENFLDQPI